MERLDQGHLHPNLEVPRLTCLGRESNPASASTLGKSYLEHLHMSPGQYNNYIFPELGIAKIQISAGCLLKIDYTQNRGIVL
jgi:hypothetical protein